MATEQINNTKKLLKLVKENPNLPVVPMVFHELVADDYGYWEGSFGSVSIDDYWNDGERIWFKNRDHDDLIDRFIVEQEDGELEHKHLLKFAEEKLKKIPWKKAIVIYIELP